MNTDLDQQGGDQTIGNTVNVFFRMFNKEIEGKVDTGATTSSLHATDMQINKERQSVSFKCEALSPNVITLDLQGSQEVHSADHGGDVRPVVALDISIGDIVLSGVTFNLNDRSNMDAELLVGQNILKAGNFKIDVNKDEPESENDLNDSDSGIRETEETKNRIISEDEEIVNAIEVLREKNVTIDEIFRYLTTKAIQTVENLE